MSSQRYRKFGKKNNSSVNIRFVAKTSDIRNFSQNIRSDVKTSEVATLVTALLLNYMKRNDWILDSFCKLG